MSGSKARPSVVQKMMVEGLTKFLTKMKLIESPEAYYKILSESAGRQFVISYVSSVRFNSALIDGKLEKMIQNHTSIVVLKLYIDNARLSDIFDGMSLQMVPMYRLVVGGDLLPKNVYVGELGLATLIEKIDEFYSVPK